MDPSNAPKVELFSQLQEKSLVGYIDPFVFGTGVSITED
jgi:hypothetical protein